MLLDDLATHGETQPWAAGACAEPGFKDSLQMLGTDSGTGIGDADWNFAALSDGMPGKFDQAAARHRVQSIEHYVREHLFQAMTVSRQHCARQPVTQNHPHSRLPGKRGKEIASPVEQRTQVDERTPRRQRTVLRTMKVQNIIDGGGQSAQPHLNMLYPLLAFGTEFGLSQ